MKCRYCWKETNKEFCNFKCRKAYLDHHDEEDKTAARKRPLLVMSFVFSIPLIVLFGGAGVTVMCILMGIVLIRHPFPPKEMKRKMSPKAKREMMMILGIVLIIAGLPFLLLTGSLLNL